MVNWAAPEKMTSELTTAGTGPRTGAAAAPYTTPKMLTAAATGTAADQTPARREVVEGAAGMPALYGHAMAMGRRGTSPGTGASHRRSRCERSAAAASGTLLWLLWLAAARPSFWPQRARPAAWSNRQTGAIVIEAVGFPSEGATLRGLLFRPPHVPRPPVVIMAHGTSATIGMVADAYAEAFRESGLAVLLYDHRNLGASGGEPRQEINPWIQCRGYLHALDFVQELDGVDRDRIGLWGDSYSGGEVIVVGAADDRVTAIVAQVPVCGREPPALDPAREHLDAIRTTLLGGDVAGGPDDRVGPLPVVSADQLGTPSLLEPIQAFRWFIEHGGRHGSGWVNRVTRVVPATPVPYSPVLCAPFVTAPTLMMVAPEDEMIHADRDVARLAYELMPAPKQWHDIAGGHFGLLYRPSLLFDEATSVQTAFLHRWLSP